MDDVKYYAMFGSERVGPMSLDELRNLSITPNTPVWRTGMPDWANASTFPELASYFAPPQQSYPPYNQMAGQAPGPAYAAGGNSYYGQTQGNGPMPPRPDNYLVWSILVTILCCLVGGIVALVYSSKVNSCYDRGDYDGALKASSSARTWCIVSAIVGFVFSVGYTGAVMLGALGNLM